jgi:hypothetical protein
MLLFNFQSVCIHSSSLSEIRGVFFSQLIERFNIFLRYIVCYRHVESVCLVARYIQRIRFFNSFERLGAVFYSYGVIK